MNGKHMWERYKKYLCITPTIGLSLDISRMNFPDDFFGRMEPMMQKAFRAMRELEAGAVANPDENRMVGHYWLRNPALSPDHGIRREIEETIEAIKGFSFSVHAEKIKPKKRGRFKSLLVIGIGGSALGPQLAADALSTPADRMNLLFLDNTDPDGFDRVLAEIGDDLEDTMVLVISKSGGTVETGNGMIETAAAFKKAGLSFERHAVAITGVGSTLDETAKKGGWLYRFPMWDWVGGRTSITSAVGLLPMSLQGIDIDEFLKGARLCDEATRIHDTRSNPAALLALAWHYATDGRGQRDMVIMPYKDRLMLFPKYLQQLIMESLGKEKDLDGRVVNQGIAVYGNKGATDQHAYVQQLREGVNNFFVTFIETLKDREGDSIEIGAGITSGDYLDAFLHGTRNALHDNGRESITITIEGLDARSLGALIALYERTVGLYASLINVNAYHQPGVEAGKKMAASVVRLQQNVLSFLKKNPGRSFTAEETAAALGAEDQVESIYRILVHASANKDHRVIKEAAKEAYNSRFGME